MMCLWECWCNHPS